MYFFKNVLFVALGVENPPRRARVTAFDAYALAAASVQQWSYAASMAHKSLVLKIAGDARANNTSVAVAVIYDELVRQRMATRAASKAPNFSPDDELLEVDRTLLERATETYQHPSKEV